MPHRKKSIATRPTPKVRPQQGLEGVQFNDPKLFERYKFFSTRKFCKPCHLDLEVARHFGIYDEVLAMIALPEWRYLLMEFEEDTHVDLLLEVMTTLQIPKNFELTYTKCVSFTMGRVLFQFSADELSDLMGFRDVQQLPEQDFRNRCVQVANTQAFWEELTRGTTQFRSSKVRSTSFKKKEHKFMQYVLSHSIYGRFDSTDSVSHADMLCPYLTRILKSTKRVPLTEPKIQGMQALTVEVVQRMRQGKGEKRARVTLESPRMDAMEAANAQGREEARAYYEWIRGHYPPPGVAAVPTIRSLLHGLMCWAASIFEKLSN
nr:hypothetical protein Iba_chr05eCG8960 [Ipomoea batatas]